MTLEQRAWKVFSEYIRRRGADWRGNTTCFTCRRQYPWKEMHAAHRWHNKLDFDERNIKPCCNRCNNYLHGNLGAYERHLIEDYGMEWAKQLEQDAVRDIRKRTPVEYKEITNKYTELLKKL